MIDRCMYSLFEEFCAVQSVLYVCLYVVCGYTCCVRASIRAIGLRKMSDEEPQASLNDAMPSHEEVDICDSFVYACVIDTRVYRCI
jgi:hypothetical protein